MKPSLQLKFSQQLTMTPQLQQAIKLLQLSNLELEMFVEEQVQSNPLLERGTGDENRREEALDPGATDAEFKDLDMSGSAQAEAQLDAPVHAVDSEAIQSDRAGDVGGSVDWSKSGSGGSFRAPASLMHWTWLRLKKRCAMS